MEKLFSLPLYDLGISWHYAVVFSKYFDNARRKSLASRAVTERSYVIDLFFYPLAKGGSGDSGIFGKFGF